MGKLNKVLLKNPSSSNFNLSRKIRFTAAPGVLYPIVNQECVPGDKVSFNIDALIKTYPLLAPLMGSFKIQVDAFFSPTRLYSKALHFNRRVLESPAAGTFPIYRFGGTNPTDTPATRVHESSLLSFLGFPAGFCNPRNTTGGPLEALDFNALPICTYIDIFRNYYCNPQEAEYASGGIFFGANSHTLEDLTAFIENVATYEGSAPINTAAWSNTGQLSLRHNTPLGGLFFRTYQPDINSAWLNKATYDSFVGAQAAKINVQNNAITVNQIRVANHLTEMVERSIISGSRYPDWVKAQFGVRTDHKYEIPEFLGSFSSDIVFDDVIQTAPGGSDDPLGTLGGRGVGGLKGMRRHFTATENGTFMLILSLVPRVDYFQGIAPDLMKTKLADTFVPAKDCIGFQPVMQSQLCALPALDSAGNPIPWDGSDSPFNVSLGYQPAWTEYTTAVNRLHGDFCSTLNYWTLSRQFQYKTAQDSPTTTDFSSYVNPALFNFAFADTSPSAENFLVQCSFDLKMRRPISKQSMPRIQS